MMDREIGGIRCRDVLALLSELVDGELGDAECRCIEAHVASCTECLRFGADFERVLRTLRDADVSPAIAAALDARLRSRK